MGCLYKLTSPSGKSYVGITLFPLEKRLQEHIRYAGRRRGCGPLRAAIRKYGIETFQTSVLSESDDWGVLCQLERAAIVQYGTRCPSGYNMTSGGDGVPDLAEDAKRRHRENTASGTLAAWRREDSSLRANRAAVFSTPEFKRKHSAATAAGTAKAYQRPEVRAVMLASHATPEYRARVSAAVRTLWADPEYRAQQVAKRRARTKGRSPESIQAQGDRMRALIAERKRLGTYWNNRKDIGNGTRVNT